MRQRTVVWDSKCEVRSVRTPFGEVQIFCPFWVAALIGNKEICFREITQFPSSVNNVFFIVCQVNSIQMTERLWDSNGGHRCWLFCKDVQYTSMPTFGTFFQTCIFGTANAANWKVSSKEYWDFTHTSFQNAVQLRLQIFQSYICVFRSLSLKEMRRNNESGFRKHSLTKLLDPRKVHTELQPHLW